MSRKAVTTMVVIRSFVTATSFAILAVTNVSPPCHGFSLSISTRTRTRPASVAKHAFQSQDNDVPEALAGRGICLASVSDAINGEAFENENPDIDSNHVGLGSPPTGFQRMATSIFAAVLSLVVCTSAGVPFQGEPGGGSLLSLARPQVCHALTTDQLLVDDVWREVGRQFFDPTFNGQGDEGWKKQRLVALVRAADLGPDDDAKLYAIIRGMLKSLNDPYTRFLTPEQFESLTNTYASNSISNPATTAPKTTAGIGVQLIGDNKAPSSQQSGGMVIVVNTVSKSPAVAAGIRSGDFIRSVDGVDMVGATAEAVAARCRGETGTTVTIEIERPAVEGGQEPNAPPDRQTVVVTRALVAPLPMIEASTVVVPTTNQRVGIVKINSFTQETEQAVRRELKQMSVIREADDSSQTEIPTEAAVSAIAIDLRGNVGGYMPAGVDVAKMFLPPRARIISEVDKTGRAKIYINDGVGSETDTTTPLFVLVDEKTASASEILTAALQDNKRAVVVTGGGADRTFGKGRIQNVQALSYGGSGIAITKAKYTTPNGRDIQGVGISPDLRSKTCLPKDSAAVCLESIL